MSDVLNAVMAQYDANAKSAKKKPKVSDEERLKRYFSTNLPKNKETGQKVFRILPPKNGESPFHEVWYHEIKIDDSWSKLYCPKKNKKGECPLCEVEKGLMDSGKKEDKDIASQYRARKFYIVKGIDRDLEDDGPKFWRFRHNFKKQGIFDKIISVFSLKGDITHPEKGRDLILMLGKDDGYTKVTSIVHEDQGLLSEDPDTLKAWVEDESTWEDVYAQKPFDYLDIIARGEIPYWDKDLEKFITKTEWEEKNNNGVSVETINDDGETTATIGGGKSEIKDKPASTISSTKLSEKVVEKPKGKKTPVKVVEVDENDDNADVEMEDLPF
jgi:hypothetical protein